MRLLIFGFFIGILFMSCGTQKAVYNYLEDMQDTAIQKAFFIKEPVIQNNDMLSIQIYSASLDEKVDMDYNLRFLSTGNQQQNQEVGYLVNQRGNIELPRLGIVRAEGLTKAQLADLIKSKLKGLLTDPTVIIRFINFRVVVMGEVGAPGVQTIPVENLTILEALAMAGDITEFGKKKEVKILRENNGTRQMGIVDVTSTKMFESPYYQLKQNDVILVEQTRYRVRQTEQERILTQIGFVTGIVSTAAIIISLVTR
jgi:polysaccharide export outer membrane protein